MARLENSLYETLGIERESTQGEVKKAYRKLSLKYHPDKNTGKEAAKMFIEVTKAYKVLSDEKKRALYDGTGMTDVLLADLEDMSVEDHIRYCAQVFESREKLSMNDITAFFAQRDSETADGGVTSMEDEDIRAAYDEHDGDMKKVMRSVPGARAADLSRYVAHIDKLIASGDLQPTEKFQRTRPGGRPGPKRKGGRGPKRVGKESKK